MVAATFRGSQHRVALCWSTTGAIKRSGSSNSENALNRTLEDNHHRYAGGGVCLLSDLTRVFSISPSINPSLLQL